MTPRSSSLCVIGLLLGGCQLINGVADLEVEPGDATSAAGGASSSATSASGGAGGLGAGGAAGGTGGETCEASFDVVWANNYGDGFTQGAFGVAMDEPGNTWVVGDAGGEFDIGGFHIDVNEPQDVVGAKLDLDGAPLFAHQAGGLGLQTAWGVTVGTGDTAYIVGEYQGGLDPLAELPSSEQMDVFVVQVDKSGTPGWGRGFRGSEDEGKNVNVGFDSFNKRVVIGGNFTGTMEFDSTFLAEASGQDLFVAELAAENMGLVEFARGYGGTGDQTLIGMATGPMLPRIALVGEYDGFLDFGDGALPTPRGLDKHGFVALLDGNKDVLFTRPLGGGARVAARAVAFAPGGDVVVAGSFVGSVDLGGELFTATANDGFVARYTVDGDLVWAKHLAGSGSQFPNSIAVAPNGTVWVGGVVDGGALDCGCGELPSGGGEDGFVARFDDQGNKPFCHQFGDGEQQRVTGLAIREGALRLCGFFDGVMQLGGETLTSVGQVDLFVAGVAPQ